MAEMAGGQDVYVDATSSFANKTLTGELATKEKIAAYKIDIPPLGFSAKVITVLELIGMTYVLYLVFNFIIHHVTHVVHLLSSGHGGH